VSAVLRVTDLVLTVPGADEPDILRGIGFELRADETLGIVGESGSGKSMTVRSLMRLTPDEGVLGGSILHQGREVLAMTAADLRAYRRSDVGMIFQDPHAALNPVRRIGDFMTEGSVGKPRAERRDHWDRATRWLADVGIREPGDVMRRFPHELSGGMLQRVMIASVASTRPGIILADEPTTALDVTTQSDVLALLADVRRESGAAMILISHDIELVAAVCDRILVMYRGRVVEELTPAQLRAGELQEPYTRALLASRPSIHTRVDRLPVADPEQWGERYA
jgi:ABC-type dipeptide/oligopeptide/nickel transport system ATPase component